ncbi:MULTISPECIES: branched-chain amino acid ABC transporter permease [Anaeromyxobacter]|uniref:branched-chain amino acid ABC transporter permease n=1 Tax=Anaeromyxobacter TaxID=161492 RepID=UPI001F582E0D|nr:MULTISPECIES: branched-chain amino acid ABC transporter permease [unclassified Anaeromyxobacter]
MNVFLQSVISGILVGGVYALIGIGLTIIFGVMRVINFAHGDLLMLGMYATWLVFSRLGIDPFVSVAITGPLLFLWGAFLQKTLINRVLNALPQNQILLTIGLGLIMSNSIMLMFTSDYRILTTTYSSSSFSLGGISISEPLLVAFLITAVITAALYWFLLRTDTGQAIRATAQDRDAAQLMGINVQAMSVLAFGIGSALAGVAGALISPTYYIFPQVGSTFTLKAFVIVVLGGMGSVIGATLGGLIIGVTESLSAVYIASGLKELVVFVLFLGLLLFKPSGLLGKTRA